MKVSYTSGQACSALRLHVRKEAAAAYIRTEPLRKFTDEEMRTNLHSTKVGHRQFIKSYLEAYEFENEGKIFAVQMGAPLHDLDAAGQTALHYAVSNYGRVSAEITEYLVAAGCDVNAR